MTIGPKIVSRLKRFVEGLKQRGEIQRLKDEIADAHAFIFMIGAATTDDDMKGTLDEQIEWLRERLTPECDLVHCSCGACGFYIRESGRCGCEDIEHPVGPLEQTIHDHRAAQINLLRAGLDTVHEKIHAIEQELDTLSPTRRRRTDTPTATSDMKRIK